MLQPGDDPAATQASSLGGLGSISRTFILALASHAKEDGAGHAPGPIGKGRHETCSYRDGRESGIRLVFG